MTDCDAFEAGSNHTKYDIMCTAYAMCEYIMEMHPRLNLGARRDDVFTWLLLMSCIYIHNWVADTPYNMKTYASPIRKTSLTLMQEFLVFCDIALNLPFTEKKTRDCVSGDEGDVFVGNLIRVLPFKILT